MLLITTSYPPVHATGAEAAGSFVADFAEQLSRSVEVTVVAPGKESVREGSGSLEVRRFACDRLPLSLLNPLSPLDWGAIVRVLRRGGRVTEQVVREKRPDHMLALWALPSGYWARRVSRAMDIPYSVWTLGSDIWTLGKIPYVRTVLGTVLHEANRCFADGLLLRDDTVRLGRGRSCQFLPSSRKLPVIPRQPGSGTARKRLAFLGRWHTNKGIDILLAALESLNDGDWSRIEEIRIFGGGPLEPMVRRRCEDLFEKSRPVTLGGYLAKYDAAALLSWADFLVIPSRIESIPVVFSDAMQAGCAVIASPVGDLPRLIEEYQVGFSARSATPGGIADAIRLALMNNTSDFGAALTRASHEFSVQHACSTFLQSLPGAVF